MGAAFGYNPKIVRAAANLVAAAEEATSSVPCYGCALVAWHVTQDAADADQIVAAVVQVSMDPSTTADASSTWQDYRAGTGVIAFTTDVTAVVANAGGTMAWIAASIGTGAAPVHIPWQKARLKLTGHAANVISSVQVTASVFHTH